MYLLSIPKFIFFHVIPASSDLYAPPLVEPLMIVHGFLSALQDAAYIVLGSSGANSISTMPIESDKNKIFSHESPPSTLLYRPLSSLFMNGCPIAATYIISGSLGCISTAPICPTPSRPT